MAGWITPTVLPRSTLYKSSTLFESPPPPLPVISAALSLQIPCIPGDDIEGEGSDRKFNAARRKKA